MTCEEFHRLFADRPDVEFSKAEAAAALVHAATCPSCLGVRQQALEMNDPQRNLVGPSEWYRARVQSLFDDPETRAMLAVIWPEEAARRQPAFNGLKWCRPTRGE